MVWFNSVCFEFDSLIIPYNTVVLSIVTVVTFIKDKSESSRGALTDRLAFDPKKKKQIWRYLTYVFVHAK